MAISALQTVVSANTLQSGGAKGKSNVSSSVARGFESFLGPQHNDQGSPPAGTQQAAAEVLRMEMMHSTLSLFGEGENNCSSSSSGTRALETLLSGLSGNQHRSLQAAGQAKGAVGKSNPEETALLKELSDPENLLPSRETLINEIGKTAAAYVGTPYRFGGEGANGIDCSSFVQHVFHEHQIELPRTAREQIRLGTDVNQGELKKGDLLFFHTYASYPSHVGIYLGDGKMIHASSAKGEVTVSDINSSYYRSHFIGAKRIT